MCDRLKMTFGEVKLLKNKNYDNKCVYSPLVKLVSSIFDRAEYSLSRERVAIVSSSFKKSCVLRSFFSKKILTTSFDSQLKSLIQLNRFQADTIIIEHKYLQAFASHYLTGITQHKYKRIYVLSDETLDVAFFNTVAATRLAVDSNFSRVKLVNEIPCLPYQGSTSTPQENSTSEDQPREVEVTSSASAVSANDSYNVTHLDFRFVRVKEDSQVLAN